MINIGLGLAKQVVDISRRAGTEIMKVYQTDFAVEEKADSSPVTEADQLAEDVILRSIREGITGEFPIISEEAFSAGNAPVVRDQVFWLVDPLDGTKEFISRNGEFTVNVALIENTRPILGVVHLPAQNVTYFGFNMGAFRMTGDEPRQEIKCRQAPAGGLSALVSRSHRTPEVDAYLQKFQIANEVSAGSSLKFCRLAEAAADIYPRMGRTMEWDTAAGHAILLAAGGSMEMFEGGEFRYGKPKFLNGWFVVRGG